MGIAEASVAHLTQRALSLLAVTKWYLLQCCWLILIVYTGGLSVRICRALWAAGRLLTFFFWPQARVDSPSRFGMWERWTFIYAHIIKHLFHSDPRAPCYLLKQGIFLKLINKLIEVDLIHMLKTLLLAMYFDSQNSWIDFLAEPFAWLWPQPCRPVIGPASWPAQQRSSHFASSRP